MFNPLNYHKNIKGNQHIFLYCVCGRSSSTAFQRILNSSNEVLIWGEFHGLLDITINLINHVKKLSEADIVNDSLKILNECVKQNKHLAFYPNAIGNLDSSIDLLNSSISNILKPSNQKTKRFGFKEISIQGFQTLEHLREIYPESFFIFCFRDPIKQWPSISKLNWWSNVDDLEKFLDEYYRIANVYLEFSYKNNINAFVENSDLRDERKLNHIIKYANISSIDKDLINVTVNSANADEISNITRRKITDSDGYKSYLKMKEVSKSFYNSSLLNSNL